MKTAVCYASFSGTAEKCARRIAAALPETELFNMEKRRVPDLSGFGLIVVGCGIRMGKLSNGAVRFLDSVKPQLERAETAFFLCNGYPEYNDTYFANLFPQRLLEKSLWHGSLGGELELSRLSGFDKLLMAPVIKSGELPEMHLDEQAIEQLISLLRAACGGQAAFSD